LPTVEEAVAVRRTLAMKYADAFTPDLARSLRVLGDLYGETGQSELSLRVLVEAIRCLTPTFMATPAAADEIMDELVQSYQARCKAIGREPDEELLGAVLAQMAHSEPAGRSYERK
jgi:hypothetical protein